jgi:hypothetical protein
MLVFGVNPCRDVLRGLGLRGDTEDTVYKVRTSVSAVALLAPGWRVVDPI